jgi:hypothetical protein
MEKTLMLAHNPDNMAEYNCYTCLKCAETNWRSYIPQTLVKCDYCGKEFFCGVSVYSKAKLSDEKDKDFMDKINVFAKVFPPRALYVYDEFVVFDYNSVIDATRMFEWKKQRLPLFQGITHEQNNEGVVFIDTSDKKKGDNSGDTNDVAE